MKIQILFYHYILNQDEKSLIYQFLQTQIKYQTTKGEWINCLKSSMSSLDIQLSDIELKSMKKPKLNQILNERIRLKSLEYLLKLRKSKGSELLYKKLEMASYLLPNDSTLTISDKKLFFAIQNRMINIHGNFSSRKLDKFCKAGCNELETMEHIYNCKILNSNINIIPYEQIYYGSLQQQIEIFKIMKTNLEKRNNIVKNQLIPRDPM